MAKNEKRIQVTLACEVCKRRNYITTKNKVNDRERIEMKKFCSVGPPAHPPQGDPLGAPGGVRRPGDPVGTRSVWRSAPGGSLGTARARPVRSRPAVDIGQ